MNSKRKMWFTIFGLVVGIMVGIYIQPVISGDNIYEQLKKFQEVLLTVQKNYVDDVDTPKLVEAAIVGMLKELDPHSVYIPAEQQKKIAEEFRGNFDGIGIEFDVVRDTITVITPIRGGPSYSLGIISGDKIIAIDGQNAVGIDRNDVPKKLRGPKGTKVKVTIVRPGTKDPTVYDITRDKIPLNTVDAAFVDANGTGYLVISSFYEQTYTEMMNALSQMRKQGMKRLVLDLRGNPGGLLMQAIYIADEFIPGGHKIVYTKSERRGVGDEYNAQSGQEFEDVPLVVMINPGSASASEIVSGAVQDLDRGIVVGETSFGKGLVQQPFDLPDGSAFRVTVARYYTPSGRLIQHPYDKDFEEYYKRGYKGDEDEGDNMSHSRDKYDSTRPVFKTLSGRRVLGGGGITPDYIVKSDTLTKTAREIVGKNLIWGYTEQFMSRNGPQLRSQYKNDFQSFLNGFSVNDQMFGEFTKMATDKGVTIDRNELGRDEKFLRNWVKAYIARSIWGNNEYYQVFLQEDKQYLKAVQLFPEATKLAKLSQR